MEQQASFRVHMVTQSQSKQLTFGPHRPNAVRLNEDDYDSDTANVPRYCYTVGSLYTQLLQLLACTWEDNTRISVRTPTMLKGFSFSKSLKKNSIIVP
jgi:hypothetical protein